MMRQCVKFATLALDCDPACHMSNDLCGPCGETSSGYEGDMLSFYWNE